MDETFSIVDPADVRWVFLSHDDTDHTGSLFEVMERCPHATLVTSWFSVQRMAADRLLPLHRLRIVNPGESFVAGDRTLTAVVPPVYDSPTTRGLHDNATGVYWGADAFALLLPRPSTTSASSTPDSSGRASSRSSACSAPGSSGSTPPATRPTWASSGSSGPAWPSAHGVALRSGQIDSAVELMKELPHLPPAALTSQADLDTLLSMLPAPAVAA